LKDLFDRGLDPFHNDVDAHTNIPRSRARLKPRQLIDGQLTPDVRGRLEKERKNFGAGYIEPLDVHMNRLAAAGLGHLCAGPEDCVISPVSSVPKGDNPDEFRPIFNLSSWLPPEAARPRGAPADKPYQRSGLDKARAAAAGQVEDTRAESEAFPVDSDEVPCPHCASPAGFAEHDPGMGINFYTAAVPIRLPSEAFLIAYDVSRSGVVGYYFSKADITDAYHKLPLGLIYR